MKLAKLLAEKRVDIQKKWAGSILETYPSDTQRFFTKQKDPFANPVGHTIANEVEGLLLELLQDLNPKAVSARLDRIVRIRAIQDFSPSQAVSFVFALKNIIRREMEKDIRAHNLFDELSVLDARIDEMALLAFDVYMACREKLYEIRSNEAKNQVSNLLKKAGFICEIPPWDPEKRQKQTPSDPKPTR